MPRIGKYDLGPKIGEGAFGTVKVATDVEDGSRWAVKIITKERLKADPTLSSRLAYEIRILKLLDHPNVTPLREVLATENYYYLVFPLAAGDLHDRIKQLRRAPEAVARRLFGQLSAGIRYLHAHRVVHRDLKPENLLVDEHDRLKIADFGLATVMKRDPETGATVLLQEFCGTLAYTAPEVQRRQPYDGRPADMWACGVILHVMLTGQLPFRGKKQQQQFEADPILRYDPPDVLSEGAQDLIARLLRVDPSERLSAEAVLGHPWLSPCFAADVATPTPNSPPFGCFSS